MKAIDRACTVHNVEAGVACSALELVCAHRINAQTSETRNANKARRALRSKPPDRSRTAVTAEYLPWSRETVIAKLGEHGCRCTIAGDVLISTSASQVEGDTWSYRSRHTCPMCRTSVVEIADPNYVMPADVDR